MVHDTPYGFTITDDDIELILKLCIEEIGTSTKRAKPVGGAWGEGKYKYNIWSEPGENNESKKIGLFWNYGLNEYGSLSENWSGKKLAGFLKLEDIFRSIDQIRNNDDLIIAEDIVVDGKFNFKIFEAHKYSGIPEFIIEIGMFGKPVQGFSLYKCDDDEEE